MIHSYSFQNPGEPIDYSAILSYPLCPSPLSIANSDGQMRKNTKSELKKVLFANVRPEASNLVISGTLIIDVISLFHTIGTTPSKFKDYIESVITKVKSLIPTGCNRIDFVADNYLHEVSPIKKNEQNARGLSERYEIKSLKTTCPDRFRERMFRNPHNKSRLIELLAEFVCNNKETVLGDLNCSEIYISTEGKCIRLTTNQEIECLQLSSNQPEADTRVILHARHAVDTTSAPVFLFSPSGDTDIVVLAISLLADVSDRVTLIDGSGQHRRKFKLSSFDQSNEMNKWLIGFHSFTGNDFVSSFFKHGKRSTFEFLMKNRKYQKTFAKLGDSLSHTEILQSLPEIENFLCALYRTPKRCTTVNEARVDLFRSKLRKNKTIDLAMLPPCQSVLHLYLLEHHMLPTFGKKLRNS